MKIVRKISFMILFILLMLVPTSCFGGKFSDISSGTKIELNDENITQFTKIKVDIDGKYNLKDELTGVNYNIKITGYEDYFKYFNVQITVVFNIKVMDDKGDYLNKSFEVICVLDGDGNVKEKGKHEFDIKYIHLSDEYSYNLSVEGYVVKY